MKIEQENKRQSIIFVLLAPKMVKVACGVFLASSYTQVTLNNRKKEDLMCFVVRERYNLISLTFLLLIIILELIQQNVP